ncbi:zinc finger protein 513-like [Macrobrachium rosenbergii]|uniref:zinc finger protein 513-like n=1 Tax=Macrobrachium rosenbergii TaxID=79674 RepID=UPI0034D5B7C0
MERSLERKGFKVNIGKTQLMTSSREGREEVNIQVEDDTVLKQNSWKTDWIERGWEKLGMLNKRCHIQSCNLECLLGILEEEGIAHTVPELLPSQAIFRDTSLFTLERNDTAVQSALMIDRTDSNHDEGGNLLGGTGVGIRKQYFCPLCPKSFLFPSHLERHVRTHTGERTFACPYCPHRAARKDHLDVHLRTHSGDKPFACSQCPFRTAFRSSLEGHMRTHAPQS